MSEEETIRDSKDLQTRTSLVADLGRFQLAAAPVVLVHSSLSSLGWVCGGPVALIQALLDWVGPEGTLAMPTHSGDLSDPAKWENPPVPKAWWEPIRQHMPAYDPALTPTRGLGRTPEIFRTWPGSLRSNHPTLSFTALGPQARFITEGHSLEFGLGEGSPLARLYELEAWVLLLGAGYDSNTSFHLAEYRAVGAKVVEQGSPVMIDGQRRWQIIREIEFNEQVFSQLGTDFEGQAEVQIQPVGSASARLFRQTACVDFAAPWIERHRQTSSTG